MFVLLALASGCTQTEEATLLESVYFRWNAANHRLSYMQFRPDDMGGVEAALVGGTSTTKQLVLPLPDTCDEAACVEFPITDDAEVRLGWATLSTSSHALRTARADLLTGETGASAVLSVELPRRVETVAAVLRGFSIDTNHPLDGDPSCYRPEYGWHPRQIEFSIDDVVRTDEGADVTVRATFAPGATEDEMRACIDEVYERARVPVSVDVLVIGDPVEVAEQAVTASVEYEFSGNQFNPGEQVEVEPSAWELDRASAVIGWSSVDFSFNPENKNERGAYLRSWGFEATEEGARGVATNFSRGTQLHEMAYTFSGTVRGVSVEGEIERGVVEQTIEALLDTDDRPVVQTLALE